MEDKLTFVTMVGQVLRQSEQVLRFYEIIPRFQTAVDLSPLIQTLSALCDERRKVSGGLDYLRQMQRVLEQMQRKAVPPDGFVEGRKSGERYSQWLRATFPDASGPACRYPSKRLTVLCERCGMKDATIHLTTASAEGIERNEFCETCYSQIGTHNKAGNPGS